MKQITTKFKQTEIGLVPEEWDVLKVSDVAVVDEEVISKNDNFSEIQYLDVAATDQGQVLEVQKLNLADAPSRAKRKVKDNDILISTVRPNLKHYTFIKKAPNNLVASTGYAVISSKKADPRYLYYALTTEEFTEFLGRIADSHTSTYPAINPDVIENALIAVPSITEQKQIAEILCSLDDKIELNRRMNKTLEAIGQAIFKRWFVDFEFPNEQSKPYKSSGGEMVESELGEIPKNWNVGKLSDIANIIMGQSPKSKYYNSNKEGLPFYQGATDFGDRFPTERVYCIKNSRVAEENDILMSVRAPVGRINVANGKLSLGRGVCAMRSKIGSQSHLLYLLKVFFHTEDIIGDGSVFASVARDELSKIPVIVPPQEIVNLFERITGQTDRQYELLAKENTNLSQIRDSLLPRLMSGKIRVII